MFDKIKGAFETYSQSSKMASDPTLRNIYVKIGPSVLASKIVDEFKSLNYKTISYNETYNEIFTSKAGYEVTVILVNAGNGNTEICVSVFSPTNRGKTRKALRFLLDRFKTKFGGSFAND